MAPLFSLLFDSWLGKALLTILYRVLLGQLVVMIFILSYRLVHKPRPESDPM